MAYVIKDFPEGSLAAQMSGASIETALHTLAEVLYAGHTEDLSLRQQEVVEEVCALWRAAVAEDDDED